MEIEATGSALATMTPAAPRLVGVVLAKRTAARTAKEEVAKAFAKLRGRASQKESAAQALASAALALRTAMAMQQSVVGSAEVMTTVLLLNAAHSTGFVDWAPTTAREEVVVVVRDAYLMKTASSKPTAAAITAVVHSTVIAGPALSIVAEGTLTLRAPTRPLLLPPH